MTAPLTGALRTSDSIFAPLAVQIVNWSMVRLAAFRAGVVIKRSKDMVPLTQQGCLCIPAGEVD